MSNSKCNFHLYLGKKDYEILQWKNSLPPKCFKYFVEQILLSYINGYKIMLPPIQEHILVEPKSKPIHIVIVNEQIASFLSQLNAGEKSKTVKEIVLFYIREAQDSQFVSSNKKKKKRKPPQPSISVDINKIKKERIIDKEIPVVIEQKDTNIKPNINIPLPQPTTKPVEAQSVNKNEQQKAELPKKPAKQNPMMQALFKMSGDE